MMAYLVRSRLSGGDLGRELMGQIIDNAERYLKDAVSAGTIKPSRDPKARATFLAMSGGGRFLLYLHMHDNPTQRRPSKGKPAAEARRHAGGGTFRQAR